MPLTFPLMNPVFDNLNSGPDSNASVAPSAFFLADDTALDPGGFTIMFCLHLPSPHLLTRIASCRTSIRKYGAIAQRLSTLVFSETHTDQVSDGHRSMLDCPDPQRLYSGAEIKVWKKKEAIYREAEEVRVYDEKGLVVGVDGLAEAVQPGNAVVASVSLNL